MTTTAERREHIIEHIQTHGTGRVDDFSNEFSVSKVTIRNDLRILEKQGCVERVYGGATLNKQFAFDRSLKIKGKINTSIKTQIAREALKLIQPGETVILDSGSTTEQIALNLADDISLVVFTNAINIAYHLASHPKVEVIVAGGTMRQDSFSIHGANAENHLNQYRFDKVFLGVDGFDLESGITTPHKGEAQLNRIMCRVAKQVIAVTDSSKFDQKSFCIITAAKNIDVLITDSGIPDLYIAQLEQHGVTVIIADK